MKALSIRQPWAWLIVRPDLTNPLARNAARERGEIKDIENRDWSTGYVGPLLIHAGQTFELEAYDWVREHFPKIKLPHPDSFARGGIVGRTIITGCVRASRSPWFLGEFGFLLTASEPLPFTALRGQLGFFEVPGFARPTVSAP